jgi:hypothetical protein
VTTGYDTDLSYYAEREREHDERLVELVNGLVPQIDAAMTATRKALAAVMELQGSGVYDVEMAESADGDDAERTLDAVLVHLRAVMRIAVHRKALLDATEAEMRGMRA